MWLRYLTHLSKEEFKTTTPERKKGKECQTMLLIATLPPWHLEAPVLPGDDST